MNEGGLLLTSYEKTEEFETLTRDKAFEWCVIWEFRPC